MISFNYDSDNFIMRSMLALRYRNKAIYDVYMMFIGVFMPSFSNIQLHILPLICHLLITFLLSFLISSRNLQ